MKKSFLVVYEKGRRNYSGFAPDVPGCGSIGNSLEEMRTNLSEALQLYFDTAVELGYPLPEPVSTTVTLPIKGELDAKTTYVVERLTINLPRSRKAKSHRPQTKPPTLKGRVLQAA